MKLFAAGISHKTAPVELREQLAVKQSAIVDLAFVLKSLGHLEKLNTEDDRLSAEERNNRWVPDPLVTPSNLLPTAA